MLFITYYELSENMPSEQRFGIAKKLTSSGLFPPKGVNVVRWDTTPDAWGILILEAEKAEDAMRAMGVWRIAAPGIFKRTKTAPAMPIMENMPITEELIKAVSSLK